MDPLTAMLDRADANLKRDEYEEALACAQRVLERIEQGGVKLPADVSVMVLEGRAHQRAGDAHLGSNQHTDAEQSYTLALRAYAADIGIPCEEVASPRSRRINSRRGTSLRSVGSGSSLRSLRSNHSGTTATPPPTLGHARSPISVAEVLTPRSMPSESSPAASPRIFSVADSVAAYKHQAEYLECLNSLAYVCYAAGMKVPDQTKGRVANLRAAVKWYLKLVDVSPDPQSRVQPLLSLGGVEAALGRYKEAVLHFEAVLVCLREANGGALPLDSKEAQAAQMQLLRAQQRAERQQVNFAVGVVVRAFRRNVEMKRRERRAAMLRRVGRGMAARVAVGNVPVHGGVCVATAGTTAAAAACLIVQGRAWAAEREACCARETAARGAVDGEAAAAYAAARRWLRNRTALTALRETEATARAGLEGEGLGCAAALHTTLCDAVGIPEVRQRAFEVLCALIASAGAAAGAAARHSLDAQHELAVACGAEDMAQDAVSGDEGVALTQHCATEFAGVCLEAAGLRVCGFVAACARLAGDETAARSSAVESERAARNDVAKAAEADRPRVAQAPEAARAEETCAATKIQAVHRGNQGRQAAKDATAVKTAEPASNIHADRLEKAAEPTAPGTDASAEKERAATKIQAVHRGNQGRQAPKDAKAVRDARDQEAAEARVVGRQAGVLLREQAEVMRMLVTAEALGRAAVEDEECGQRSSAVSMLVVRVSEARQRRVQNEPAAMRVARAVEESIVRLDTTYDDFVRSRMQDPPAHVQAARDRVRRELSLSPSPSPPREPPQDTFAVPLLDESAEARTVRLCVARSISAAGSPRAAAGARDTSVSPLRPASANDRASLARNAALNASDGYWPGAIAAASPLAGGDSGCCARVPSMPLVPALPAEGFKRAWNPYRLSTLSLPVVPSRVRTARAPRPPQSLVSGSETHGPRVVSPV